MRDDIAKVICERQRIGSREKSLKTSMKLDPRIDYDDDFDSGPTRFSISRRRQHGWNGKTLNENLRPLYQFLDKSVGRPWDEVNSEIRTNINPNKAIDFHVLQHVGWHVDTNSTGRHSHRYYGGLYVDDDGILCKAPHRRYERPAEPVTSLHWYDDVWFRLETRKTPAICGCVHFKHRKTRPESWPSWRNFDSGPETCLHGNIAGERKLWYVVEYVYHSPDDIFKVYNIEDYRQADGSLRRGYEYHGISENNPVRTVYYRDMPELLKKPISEKKHSANRTHLKMIRKAIEGAGQKAA